jgi:nitrous oxide reductase accessory protein NosL
MLRAMWARTWITFDPVKNVSQVCSFHCLADWIRKSGATPTNVRLALYHEPQKMIPAETAVIVMGSSAAGTMSPVSKIVFADKRQAADFAAACGGTVIDYARAIAEAGAGVSRENKMINTRRLKKGIIVEPSDGDRCPVCDMFPIRYPYGKCQIRTSQGKVLHFCSTQCLFAFLGSQTHYVQTAVRPHVIWVVDRSSGMWISGRGAFFVIGSTKVFGPMGFEAFPFSTLTDAQDFAARNGGRAVGFEDVSIDKIVPHWKYRAHRPG